MLVLDQVQKIGWLRVHLCQILLESVLGKVGQGFLMHSVQVLHVRRSWRFFLATPTLGSGGIFPAGVGVFLRARTTAVTLTHKPWQLAGLMRWQGSFISLDRAHGN
jgi:hypothetical protein